MYNSVAFDVTNLVRIHSRCVTCVSAGLHPRFLLFFASIIQVSKYPHIHISSTKRVLGVNRMAVAVAVGMGAEARERAGGCHCTKIYVFVDPSRRHSEIYGEAAVGKRGSQNVGNTGTREDRG